MFHSPGYSQPYPSILLYSLRSFYRNLLFYSSISSSLIFFLFRLLFPSFNLLFRFFLLESNLLSFPYSNVTFPSTLPFPFIYFLLFSSLSLHPTSPRLFFHHTYYFNLRPFLSSSSIKLLNLLSFPFIFFHQTIKSSSISFHLLPSNY